MRNRGLSELKKRTLSVLMSMAMLLTMLLIVLPPLTSVAKAAGERFTFSSGAVLLDESFSGDEVIIESGVFSVTVSGAQNVTIIFDGTLDKNGDGKADGITIDRRYSSDNGANGLNGDPIVMAAGTYPDGYPYTSMYQVSQELEWNGAAPVCPFLVTNGATVNAIFRGTCTFYAGTTGSTVSNNGTYTASNNGQGYAGIQVDSGSTLIIDAATDLTVYGAHQLDTPRADGTVSNGEDYDMVLRANETITADGETIYRNPYSGNNYLYTGPSASGYQEFAASGGAGIGGGGNPTVGDSSVEGYTQGTPGTIIIVDGTIEAYGGHAAAGIGGSINGAATTGKIQINGGTVTAHGGRWAAGIGDGDSVPDSGQDAPSPDFVNAKGLIEVNGGTVNAFGGVASPGIGCTDDICEGQGFGSDAASQLQIAINGGTVNAVPGFPSDFDGDFDNTKEAPAAIGAGAKSKMEPNSIYISSEAKLSCTGFGFYSLTEDGTNGAQAPTINIDSSGYLLLLRTAEDEDSHEYHSTEIRTLTLYAAQKKEVPGIGLATIYVDQPYGNIYYIDEEGVVYDEAGNFIPPEDVEEKHLTLYVDENSEELGTIELNYFFRSIALTLPDPEQWGGLYALNIPTEGMPNNNNVPDDAEYVTLTIEAQNQGTQSGWIEYPSEHNLGKDAVSDPLTDLDVNGDAFTDGLIGDEFLPNVYAYTVYFPSNATEVDLYATFLNENKDYTVKLDGTEIPDGDLTESGDQIVISATIPVGSENTKTVRLSKQDGTITGVSYKVTLIRMGDYTLDLTDPSKIYDGQPAVSGIEKAYTGDLYTHNVVDMPESVSPGSWATSGSTGISEENSLFYMANNYIVKLNTSIAVKQTSDPKVLQYILTVIPSNSTGSATIANAAGFQMGWTVTYNEDGKAVSCTQITAKPGTEPNNTTWIGNISATTIASYRSGWSTRNLQLTVSTTASGGRVTVKTSNNNTTYELFTFSVDSPTDNSSGTKESAKQEADTAAANGQTGATFDYEAETQYTWPHTFTIKKFNGQNGNRAEDVSGNGSYGNSESSTGYYEITTTVNEGFTIPDEELRQAVLTYYRLETDGSYTQLDEPPTDVGTYQVRGSLTTATYTASGSQDFTITPRPVTVLQIEKWLRYVKSSNVGTMTPDIDNPGALLLDNVVSGDKVTASASAAYYNDLSVSYSSEKITLEGVVLSGEDAYNYTTESIQTVFGQISYDMQGAIFRKTETGNWRKYYPVDNQTPVVSTSADYHSPVNGEGLYVAHAEYVRARTVNDGERGSRYAVDIEYGDMSFGFYHGVWDVNELAYKELDVSYWVGMSEPNNKLTLINYSNSPVWYQMEADILFKYEDYRENGTGISAKITSDKAGTNVVAATAWSELAAATAGSSAAQGTASTADRYLILSGTPQTPEGVPTVVGAIIIRVSPTGPGSS